MKKIFLAAGLSICINGFTQNIVKDFSLQTLSSSAISFLQDEYGKNKVVPQGYRNQILIALSFFPELKNISIEFRVIKTCKAPLTTVPSFTSVLKSPRIENTLSLSEISKAKISNQYYLKIFLTTPKLE